MLAPFGSLAEDEVDSVPCVPEVVHHAPHIGILKAVLSVLKLSLARAEREDYRTSAVVDGLAYHLNLVSVVRTAQVVDFDKVDSPFGIELEDAVVVHLSVLVVADGEVVLEPSALWCCAFVDAAPRSVFAALELVGRWIVEDVLR